MTPVRLALAWSVLRGEGAAALRDRALDHLAERRRRRSYRRRDRWGRPDDGSAGSQPAAPSPPPPVLNVLAAPPVPWRGGVQVQLAARLAAESARRPVALLYADGPGFRLEVASPAARWSEAWRRPAAAPPGLVDDGWAAAVGDALRRMAAPALHVENLADMPLATLLDLARRVPTILSLHDFAAFCPRPHLLERATGAFCDYSRDAERCARCLGAGPGAEGMSQEARREVAGRLLAAARTLVFPSQFLLDEHRRLFPGLDPERQVVIPPGTSAAPPPAPPRRACGRPLRVGFVGGASAIKGLDSLRRLIALAPDGAFRWVVYGGGDPAAARELRRHPSVTVRGYYRGSTLPRLVHRDRIDVALLLSAVPESYSLALDELAAAGVPVVALARGALADRVPALRAGRLVAPSAGAAGVLDALRALAAEAPPPPLPPPRSGDAARRMLELYREVLPSAPPAPC